MTHGPFASHTFRNGRAGTYHELPLLCRSSIIIAVFSAPRSLAMSTLNVASKANQATTLPALLVAHYAKECDQSVSIDIKIEDVDTLKSGDKTPIELAQGSSSFTCGCKEVIDELIKTYPFLQAKNENTVSAIIDKREGKKTGKLTLK